MLYHTDAIHCGLMSYCNEVVLTLSNSSAFINLLLYAPQSGKMKIQACTHNI